jgi:DNA-directed DNA polymerase III PolC
VSDRGGFVHLHTHTHNSGFDGFGRASDFAKVVKSLGQEAIAFTEHGTVRGIPEAQSACDEAGIKFIPGMEAYLCDDMDQRGLTKEERNQIKSGYDDHDTAKAAVKEAESSRRDRDHITIWAQNQVGLTNLYRLSSEAWNRGFYYKPRLDLSCIEKHSEGLLISTGCPGGIIPKAMRNRTFDEALARMERLATHFRDRLYVEIMPHIIEEAPELQDQLLAIALEFETQVIATQDAHYPCRADAIPQEVLLCVHTGETIEDVDRFSQKAFGKHDFWIKSRAQILDAFGRNVPSFDQKLVRSMCDATIDFADRCSARYDKGKPGQYLVAPTLPPGVSSYDEWMFDLCEQGWRERFGTDMIEDSPAVYREQIVREFEVFRDKGFAPYMMMVWDVIRYCREVGIFVGPGRGSAAGSMVSYLLQITKLDPIVHGLSFDRFVSPKRESLPDVDLDLQHDRRGEVIRYLQDKYGEDHVTHISTAITMGGKRVLRDVGKVHGVPIAEVERVTSSIIDSLSEEDQADDTARMALTGTEAGRKFAGTYPDAADAAQRLEGMYRDAGIHPAGIIVAPYPVRDLVPLESRRGERGRTSVTAFDMRDVEAMGFVKVDLLGLKTATSQAIMQALSGIDPDGLGLDDQQTLGAFTDGRFGGIFQYDSPAARRLCKGYTFKHFSDIAVMTALNRPGPMQTGLSQAFLDRAGNPKLIPKMHPLYAQATSETHGVLVYQEQILALVVGLCGYSMAEADDFRGKVAKKKGVAGDREKFVNGAVANSMPVDEAQSLFESVIGFGSYAFNKCVDTGTKVMTNSGEKSIMDLAPGDEILEVSEHGEVSIGHFVRRWPVERRERVELVFDDGSRVICTPEHRFLTERGLATAEEIIELDWAVASVKGLDDDVWGVVPHEGGKEQPHRAVRQVPDAEEGDPLGDDVEGVDNTWRHHPRVRVGGGEAHIGPSGDHRAALRAPRCVEGGQPGEDAGARPSDVHEVAATEGRVADIKVGGGNCAHRSWHEAERSGEVRQGEEAGRFRERRAHDRGGRATSLQADLRCGALREGACRGQDPQRLVRKDAEKPDKDLAGLFPEFGQAEADLGGDDTTGDREPGAGCHAYRRLVRSRRLGVGPVVDIEVTGSHLYALANGLVSHNSHSYAYGLIAYQMMHMKVHRSPAFFTSVLAIRDEPEIQVRLAAEARRMGIPVGPPDIQKSEGAFSLSRDARGFEEIVGSVADVKGVGAKTAEKISKLKPFSSLRDFYLRTKAAEGPGRITLTTFKALAETTALRSMCPNHKLVTVNAAKIWDALKKGYHVDLDPNSVPDYTQDEAIQTASARYPLYVDVRGRGEYDAVYDEVVGKSTRPIVMLADVPITAPDSAFALGRVNAGKLFSDGNKGQKSARVSLLSPDGVEILARADSDVVEQYGAAHFTKKGEMVLAIIATRENRDHTVSHSIEALWPASELGYTGLLGAVAHPERTKPRDPIDSMVRCPEDATFRAKGMVIRVKRGTDKKGQNMLTVGLLGRDSYIRFFVFASRVKGSDTKYLAPGNTVDVTLKKLSGDACFLTDSKIRFEAAE